MEEHGGKHGEYSLGDFKRVVVFGEHPNQESLSLEIPH